MGAETRPELTETEEQSSHVLMSKLDPPGPSIVALTPMASMARLQNALPVAEANTVVDELLMDPDTSVLQLAGNSTSHGVSTHG